MDRKLRCKLLSAYDRVRDAARQRDADWRTAAYMVTLGYLGAVYKERGIFP